MDGFCGDGLRGLGDDEVFEYNLVKNARDVNADHRDGFQSWSVGTGGVGTGVVRNITLRGNVIIGHEPGVRFAGTLQGIGCFDGTYEGWVVENNVVLTDHWHGISFYGARNLRIANNTVLDLNAIDPGPPWIMVTAHKDGTPSRDTLVRNNLTTDLRVSGDNVLADGNLLLPADPAGFFVDLAHLDVRLAAGSPAIDRGHRWPGAGDGRGRDRPPPGRWGGRGGLRVRPGGHAAPGWGRRSGRRGLRAAGAREEPRQSPRRGAETRAAACRWGSSLSSPWAGAFDGAEGPGGTATTCSTSRAGPWMRPGSPRPGPAPPERPDRRRQAVGCGDSPCPSRAFPAGRAARGAGRGRR